MGQLFESIRERNIQLYFNSSIQTSSVVLRKGDTEQKYANNISVPEPPKSIYICISIY